MVVWFCISGVVFDCGCSRFGGWFACGLVFLGGGCGLRGGLGFRLVGSML